MCDFLWEGIDERKGKRSHLIKWQIIEKIKLIHLGGFGTGNFRLCNKTRLAKWLWHFNSELDSGKKSL